MAITSAAPDRTRHQLERALIGDAAETTRTPRSPMADDARMPAGLAHARSPVALGPANALARLLMATMRAIAAGPARQERARASADLLLETIRAHSIL